MEFAVSWCLQSPNTVWLYKQVFYSAFMLIRETATLELF